MLSLLKISAIILLIFVSGGCLSQEQNKINSNLENCQKYNGTLKTRVDQNGKERKICLYPNDREGPADDYSCFHEKNNVFMDIEEAQSLAKKGDCGNKLLNYYYCNPATGTWWINLDIEKPGCSPMCVISVEDKKVEINWMCTGALVPNVSVEQAEQANEEAKKRLK